jgi:phosphohistidine phosphatase SixA
MVKKTMVAFLIAGLLLSTGAVDTRAQVAPAGPGFKATTVFLVRHAEKAVQPADDPPLSDAGVARSGELARVLADAGITAIYTSQYLRTKQTAGPLANRLGVTSVVLPVRGGMSAPGGISMESIGEIADTIYRHEGEKLLIVGHSNTVPEVIRALGCEDVPTIGDKEYDDLFVVTIYAHGKATLAHLKYGNPR